MPEEESILSYLRKRHCAAVPQLAAACLANAGPHWVGRVVSHLEWLGYVTLYYGPGGEPEVLQITDKGLVLGYGLTGRA
jgi:hypothetical protein